MNFEAGDTVMHWTYGLGKIIRLEKRDLFGREALYYAVRVGDMTLWVPADEKLKVRLRPPTSKAHFKRLLGMFSTPSDPLPPDRHERKMMLVEMLRDGRAESLCLVIRGLSAYRRIHSLNDNDQAMLRRVQSALLAEWGYVLSLTQRRPNSTCIACWTPCLPESEETMASDQKVILQRVVEHYARTGDAVDTEVKVTCLPDNKTSFVEQDASGGRSIMLDEFHVDGRVIWAGYSTRAGMVYLSSARRG